MNAVARRGTTVSRHHRQGYPLIKTLSQMTGVSEDQLTKQLSQGIPVIVNWITPNGRLPTVAELSKMMEQQ